jgi:formylglycine-generating enzyme required for sulfatase activity
VSVSTKTDPGVSGKHDRYPGPRSFIDDEVDQRLFFGREQEVDHLLHRIRSVRLLVLFGKSGLGKTSLLQAGLYPRLRARGLLPVPVRLNQPNITPIQAVFEALRATCSVHGVEYETRETDGLWEFFKATDLWRADVLQTPVLVFDQFEEIFTLQSDRIRSGLAGQLGELAGRGLPIRMRPRVQAGERYNDTPPDVKIILSLREEYVGALEDLVPDVPGIFEQRFRLAPLHRDLARRAVVEPAAMDDLDIFNTRPFRYSDGALDTIMEFLVNRQGEVEPFQLQIVCRHAEQQIALRAQGGDRDGQVDETLLGGPKAMEKLLKNFYRSAIRELAFWSQRSRARNLCEFGLLSPSGHRISVEKGQIHKQYKVSDRSLNTLTQARLVRKESRPGLEGFYYELSHDSVARAVSRSRRFRVPTRFKVAVAVLAIILLIAASLWQERVDRRIVAVQDELLREQSTLQYSHEKLSREGLKNPEMVVIPGGKFQMGDIRSEEDEQPVHAVSIHRRFAVSRYEITFEQYDQFASATGRKLPADQGWGRGRRPVINVSWQDARDYAVWLSQSSGKRYRLPSEAEWEYAARSGGKDEMWAGTSNGRELGDYAWYAKTSGGKTQEVGTKKPNSLGLYDMSGNVWELVEDCWHQNYEGAPSDGSAWLRGAGGDCDRRMVRGGSWSNVPELLRSSSRTRDYIVVYRSTVGFRLAQDLE